MIVMFSLKKLNKYPFSSFASGMVDNSTLLSSSSSCSCLECVESAHNLSQLSTAVFIFSSVAQIYFHSCHPFLPSLQPNSISFQI